jgi:hypothetical protein
MGKCFFLARSISIVYTLSVIPFEREEAPCTNFFFFKIFGTLLYYLFYFKVLKYTGRAEFVVKLNYRLHMLRCTSSSPHCHLDTFWVLELASGSGVSDVVRYSCRTTTTESSCSIQEWSGKDYSGMLLCPCLILYSCNPDKLDVWFSHPSRKTYCKGTTQTNIPTPADTRVCYTLWFG